MHSSGGSRDPELKRHLEAAKRAASALFSCKCHHSPSLLRIKVLHYGYLLASKPPAKKRKSRWGNEDVKTILPGLPTILPSNMKEDEQKLYLCK